eukprot:6197510-Alexandrium_andersonii.AAC.1
MLHALHQAQATLGNTCSSSAKLLAVSRHAKLGLALRFAFRSERRRVAGFLEQAAALWTRSPHACQWVCQRHPGFRLVGAPGVCSAPLD